MEVRRHGKNLSEQRHSPTGEHRQTNKSGEERIRVRVMEAQKDRIRIQDVMA